MNNNEKEKLRWNLMLALNAAMAKHRHETHNVHNKTLKLFVNINEDNFQPFGATVENTKTHKKIEYEQGEGPMLLRQLQNENVVELAKRVLKTTWAHPYDTRNRMINNRRIKLRGNNVRTGTADNHIKTNTKNSLEFGVPVKSFFSSFMQGWEPWSLKYAHLVPNLLYRFIEVSKTPLRKTWITPPISAHSDPNWQWNRGKGKMVRMIITCNKSYVEPVGKYRTANKHSEWVLMPGTMTFNGVDKDGNLLCTHTSDLWISYGLIDQRVVGHVCVARTQNQLRIRREHPMQYYPIFEMPPANLYGTKFNYEYQKSNYTWASRRAPHLSSWVMVRKLMDENGATFKRRKDGLYSVEGERYNIYSFSSIARRVKLIWYRYDIEETWAMECEIDHSIQDTAPVITFALNKQTGVGALGDGSRVVQALIVSCDTENQPDASIDLHGVQLVAPKLSHTRKRTRNNRNESTANRVSSLRKSPALRKYNSHVDSMRTKMNSLAGTDLKTMFDGAAKLSSGGYGETRLVHDGAFSFVIKKLENVDTAAKEFKVHEHVFNELRKQSGSSPQYISVPLRVQGMYTAQSFAPSINGGKIITLGAFLAKHKSHTTDKRLGMQLAEILANIHKVGVEHRDISTENVLVEDVSPPHMVLVDFGVGHIHSRKVFIGTATNSRRRNAAVIGGIRNNHAFIYNHYRPNDPIIGALARIWSPEARKLYYELFNNGRPPSAKLMH